MRNGRAELTFTPVDFLRRLATLIPPPHRHLTRYHGVFGPHHHLRAAVVATVSSTASDDSTNHRQLDRKCRLAWAALMKRIFASDVLVCDRCAGPMRIIAVLPEGDSA